jgi:hypothetical protein
MGMNGLLGKGVCCLRVVLEFGVVEEPQVVIKPPLVGILFDAILHERERGTGQACARRRFRG